MIKFRQKIYSQYDMTDRLKQMRDSDILAEQKRPESIDSGQISVGKSILAGGAIGGLAGGLRRGTMFKKRSAIGGMLLGAGLSTGYNMYKSMSKPDSVKQQEESNKFYNKRLEYAQKQARRREAADWKNNMTNRVEYTYQ